MSDDKQDPRALAERVLTDAQTMNHPGRLDDYRSLCFDAATPLARVVMELSAPVDFEAIETAGHVPLAHALYVLQRECRDAAQNLDALRVEVERLRGVIVHLEAKRATGRCSICGRAGPNLDCDSGLHVGPKDGDPALGEEG